jgi:hypothetical protein
VKINESIEIIYFIFGKVNDTIPVGKNLKKLGRI